ncbi:MAG: hypothetical protein IVW55_00420 [Chloroflexi bacterium]|nr:hypothetical protein [Chloroflexota bacterium]
MASLTANGVRDNQRQKVYDWENKKIQPMLKKDLTLEECRKLITEVFASYGLEPPEVKDGRGRRSACWERPYTIKLPTFARKPVPVLHECAHGIVDRYYKVRGEAPHGTTFLRIYLNLLAKFGKLPLRTLRSSAAEAHLNVAPASTCLPPPAALVRRMWELQRAERAAYSIWQNTKKELDAIRAQLARSKA